MQEIKTVGVVGFGVMGAAIALNAATAGYRIIFKELNDELVKQMYQKWVAAALQKRVAQGKMTQEQYDQVTSRITGTSRYEDLAECDLVIEAAVEKMDLKIQVFEELSKHCRPDAILVSNTSTFLIEKLMEKVQNPGRTAGLHYFFPANVNRLVEVIRQRATTDETCAALKVFAEKNKKFAIDVKDFPGFAINPVFIASYMVLDGFYGDKVNAATLDQVSKDALGVGFGIMWVQNNAGIGTSYHAGVSMVEYLGNSDVGYPPVPASLKAQFESGKLWDLEGAVLADPATTGTIRDRLLGAIFAISTHLIEKNVVSLPDLEKGVCTSLAWPKGPFALMNELGMAETSRLVKLSADAGDFKLPARFARGEPKPWEL